MVRPIIEETGNRYGHWTVLGRAKNQRGKQFSFWTCKCDCGVVRDVNGSELRSGRSKSCGCSAKEKTTLPDGHASRKMIYHRYRNGARRRHIAFNLTEDQVYELLDQNCYYCGAQPHRTYTNPSCNGGYTYNGIDRVDNAIGYNPENVVPCCFECNQAKGTMTVEEFEDWIERVYHHTCKSRQSHGPFQVSPDK